jgi:hypothetical protein
MNGYRVNIHYRSGYVSSVLFWHLHNAQSHYGNRLHHDADEIIKITVNQLMVFGQ